LAGGRFVITLAWRWSCCVS